VKLRNILFAVVISLLSTPLTFANSPLNMDEIKQFSVACTGLSIPWMFEKRNYNISNERGREVIVFSKNIDDKFLNMQDNAYKDFKSSENIDRKKSEQKLLVKLTNFLIKNHKPFIKDCIKLHKVADNKCNHFSGRERKLASCRRIYLNERNLNKIRKYHRASK
jgi:hypothetical protein